MFMDKKKIISIAVMTCGIIMLIVGVVFWALKLNETPAVADGEYLVTAGSWKLEDQDSLVWNFTEIGKGILTTNNHLNDYTFTWALEDGKILIETDWLYTLNNQFSYKLDQNAGTLLLSDGDNEYRFLAQPE